MQEIFGKKDGLCGGKGGSMHIADLSKGMLGANGIVGGGPPLICGAALTAKTLKTGGVAIALRRRRRLQPGHDASSPTIWPRSGTCRRSSSSRTTATPKSTASNWSVGGSQVGPRQRLRHAVGRGRRLGFLRRLRGRARGDRARPRGRRAQSLIHVKVMRYYGHFEGDARPTRRPTRSRSTRRRTDPLDAVPQPRHRGRVCSMARRSTRSTRRVQAAHRAVRRDGQVGADRRPRPIC